MVGFEEISLSTPIHRQRLLSLKPQRPTLLAQKRELDFELSRSHSQNMSEVVLRRESMRNESLIDKFDYHESGKKTVAHLYKDTRICLGCM